MFTRLPAVSADNDGSSMAGPWLRMNPCVFVLLSSYLPCFLTRIKFFCRLNDGTDICQRICMTLKLDVELNFAIACTTFCSVCFEHSMLMCAAAVWFPPRILLDFSASSLLDMLSCSVDYC